MGLAWGVQEYVAKKHIKQLEDIWEKHSMSYWDKFLPFRKKIGYPLIYIKYLVSLMHLFPEKSDVQSYT